MKPSPSVELTYHFTSLLYFSCPIHPMKLWLACCSPMRYAVRPFSAKQKSKRDVTSTSAVASCSCCLARFEPPTKPMATLWRSSESNCSISGLTSWVGRQYGGHDTVKGAGKTRNGVWKFLVGYSHRMAS